MIRTVTQTQLSLSLPHLMGYRSLRGAHQTLGVLLNLLFLAPPILVHVLLIPLQNHKPAHFSPSSPPSYRSLGFKAAHLHIPLQDPGLRCVFTILYSLSRRSPKLYRLQALEKVDPPLLQPCALPHRTCLLSRCLAPLQSSPHCVLLKSSTRSGHACSENLPLTSLVNPAPSSALCLLLCSSPAVQVLVLGPCPRLLASNHPLPPDPHS